MGSRCKTLGEGGGNFLLYVVLSPKTTALYESGGLKYLEHSVPLAFLAGMKKKASYNTSITLKQYQSSKAATGGLKTSLGSKKKKDKKFKSQ